VAIFDIVRGPGYARALRAYEVRVLKLSGPRPLFWLPAWLVVGRCRFLPDGPDKSRRRTARVNVRRRLRLGQLTARPVRRSGKVNR
jgi:hypothetical protein